MTTTDVDRAERRPDAAQESAFAWEWRVMAVSAVWALPGALAGALVRLCISDGGSPGWWLAGGAVLGAIGGGLLESDRLLG